MKKINKTDKKLLKAVLPLIRKIFLNDYLPFPINKEKSTYEFFDYLESLINED